MRVDCDTRVFDLSVAVEGGYPIFNSKTDFALNVRSKQSKRVEDNDLNRHCRSSKRERLFGRRAFEDQIMGHLLHTDLRAVGV